MRRALRAAEATGRFAPAILALALGCGDVAGGADGSEGGITDSSVAGQQDVAAPRDAATPADAMAGSDGLAATCPAADGGPGGAAASSTRVPANHQSAGSSCPQQRATVSADASTGARQDAGVCGECAEDSDCTAGPNGRCENGPLACLGCSYDACFVDSDCEGGVPCACRASAANLGPNECLAGSNCRVDADCGPNGYCSPSALTRCQCLGTALCGDAGGGCYEATAGTTPVGPPPGPGWTPVPCSCGDGCGHGYFCHTRCDTCIDDTDCAGQGTCNYDEQRGRWDCSECWPVP